MINVAVFLAMVTVAGFGALVEPNPLTLYRFGGNLGVATLGGGQYWRLVTCMFVHAGLLHIAMNMYCLWYLGMLAEQLFGKTRYLAVYFIAGIGGSLASAIHNPNIISIGASGAIFGVAGALLGLLLVRRDRFSPAGRRSLVNNIGFFVVLNLLLGSAIPGIDMSAHVGGLIAGFLSGAALSAIAD